MYVLYVGYQPPCARVCACACACRSPYWRILPRRPELELDAELAAILVTHVHQEYRAGPRPLWQRLLAGVVVELADLLLPTRAEYEARRLGGGAPRGALDGGLSKRVREPLRKDYW